MPENPSVPSGEYICDVKYDIDKDQYIVIGKKSGLIDHQDMYLLIFMVSMRIYLIWEQ